MTDPAEPHAPAPRKRIPPLAWIILGLLVLIIIVAVAQCQGFRETPRGVDVPTSGYEETEEAVLPTAPGPPTQEAVPP